MKQDVSLATSVSILSAFASVLLSVMAIMRSGENANELLLFRRRIFELENQLKMVNTIPDFTHMAGECLHRYPTFMPYQNKLISRFFSPVDSFEQLLSGTTTE